MVARFAARKAWPVTAVVTVSAAVAFGAGPAATAQPGAARGWRIVKTIKVSNLLLEDVVAVSGGRAWVSGGAGTSMSHPLFYHWTGGRWVKVTRPGVSGNSVFAADLSASSDSNVWGAIANGAVFDHWNGHSWTTPRFSFGTNLNAAADSVVALRSNHAWAFTTDFSVTPIQESARFFNGSTWTSQSLPAIIDADASFNQVSASSGANIWTWAIDPVLHRWEALRFNGKKWAVVKVPATLIPHHGSITGGGGQMLAQSAKSVWATVVSENLAGPMVLLHWNGAKWQRAGGRTPAGELVGPIAPDGHGGLWLYAARPLTKSSIKFFFVHYHGGTWTAVAEPTSPLGPVEISAIALIPGTRSLWGVGVIRKGQSVLGGVIIKFGP